MQIKKIKKEKRKEPSVKYDARKTNKNVFDKAKEKKNERENYSEFLLRRIDAEVFLQHGDRLWEITVDFFAERSLDSVSTIGFIWSIQMPTTTRKKNRTYKKLNHFRHQFQSYQLTGDVTAHNTHKHTRNTSSNQWVTQSTQLAIFFFSTFASIHSCTQIWDLTNLDAVLLVETNQLVGEVREREELVANWVGTENKLKQLDARVKKHGSLIWPLFFFFSYSLSLSIFFIQQPSGA